MQVIKSTQGDYLNTSFVESISPTQTGSDIKMSSGATYQSAKTPDEIMQAILNLTGIIQ